MHARQQQSFTKLLLERQFGPCETRLCSQNTLQQSSRLIDSWAECDSLKRCSATYCQLNPPPRSTIAAAFSPDGKLVASTHGDHTVKVICVRTGKCLQTLTGHRRTPWVVRFHPSSSSLLASGSLDYEVRLWNAHTAECINVHNFGRPIASLAFHIEGDALAVASGHKLYMWQYTRQQQGEDGAPPVALKTRRSLRAVHFHPLGLPLVLTAEVNDVSAPVTLPHGAHALAPFPPQAPNPLPRPSYSLPTLPEIDTQRSIEASAPIQEHASSLTISQQDDWPVERRAPRRLSEVFRALMQEEREEELMAQLETSASLQASQSHGSSASRQILGLTGYGTAQSARQHDHVPSHLLSRRPSGGFGSLPHVPVPIRPFRLPSRPRSFHPLRNSVDSDVVASDVLSSMQRVPTPFDTGASHIAGASSGVFAAVAQEEEPTRDNPIQQRARAWARQRQQECSVLKQNGSVEQEPFMRSQSGFPDVAGSSNCPHLHHTSSQPVHDLTPHPSPRDAQGLGRRQSEPLRSADDEWPVLGTPPICLGVHLPSTPPLHLPPPSPVNLSRMSTGQQLPGAQAAVGLGWAANLARGAEWMGEATGLRFLTRPFSRTVVGMAGGVGAAVRDQDPDVDTAAASSSNGQGSAVADTHPVERSASFSQLVSASAPSNGSMSYRERLLAGSTGQSTGRSNGQETEQSMVRVSPSMHSSQASQIGFPSQQELQVTQSTTAQLSSSPTGSTSPAAIADVPSSSSTAPAVSALSFRQGSQPVRIHSHRQAQSRTHAQTPAGPGPSADFAPGAVNIAPQSVPVLSEAQGSSQGLSGDLRTNLPSRSSGTNLYAAAAPSQVTAAQSAVGTQTGTHAFSAAGELGFMTWPAQLAAEPQGMAALPPSMLNMGWEYPAQLLQGPDPLPAARHRAARDDASQQPNHAVANAVRTSAAAANIIGTEQPCRVRLRLWHCSAADPTAALEVPSLTIPDAVLCSEMGVHFSACGRYLAACVACQAGHLQDCDAAGIIYEVRVYSLEAASLGQVLHAKQIKAAHCLTSVQFSPTSEHLLLAYGRRHISLLRSLVPDGTSSIIPVHTILEVYRVSDMSLVRVLPSAEDEVNAAAFHPHPGGGIAYGTKEGKLRILRHDPRPEARTLATCQQPRGLDDELREAESIYEDDVLL